MLFDRTLQLSVAQAVTIDAPSSDVLDLGLITARIYGAAAPLPQRDLGKGPAIPLVIQIVEDFNNCTSLRVVAQTDDNAAFTSPRDVKEQVLQLADLKIGRRVNINVVPPGAGEQFLRLFYDVTGAVPTAGRITAGVVAAEQTAGVTF